MRQFIAFLTAAALLWPVLAHAQSAQIEALLERQLSGDGRIVEIDGFAGALSSQARLDAVRISDDQGVWLELEDAVLDWNRSALLRGRLEVTALTAARLSVLRAPASEPSVPDAEASGFRIPDLPISIAVDQFAIARIELGDALLGTAYAAELDASASLDDTGIALTAQATRLDATRGNIQLDIFFSPDSDALAITARIDEAQDGIVATSLGLPGAPSVVFDVTGEGPLDAFDADISLATEGQNRLSGRVSIAAATDGSGRRFDADLAGDIRPLLDAETRAFFGEQTALRVAGFAEDSGALALNALDLRTAQLALTGRARLDAARAPQQLALNIILDGRGPVRLPGSDVTLGSADLSLAFDASESPDWRLRGNLRQVNAGVVVADLASLSGTGQISPGTDTPLTGVIRLAAQGVDAPGDAGLARIIGPAMTLETGLVVQASGGVALDNLRLQTPHSTANGALRVTPTDGRVQIDADLDVTLPALAPFSQIAGLPLEGALEANASLSAELPGGAIAITLDGRSERLDIGQPLLAPLLSPRTQLRFVARRDETGTNIEQLTLDNTELSVIASGDANATDGALVLNATLRDAGFVDDRLAGPVQIDAAVRDLQNSIAISADLVAGFGLDLNLNGTVAGATPALDFTGTLAQVERFAAPVNGPLSLDGTLDLAAQAPHVTAKVSAAPGIEASVEGPLSGPDASLRFGAHIADLGEIVAALPGSARANGTLDLSGPVAQIDASLAAQPGLSARINGDLNGANPAVDITAQIADLAPFVAQLPGPARLEASVQDFDTDLSLAAKLNAPKGITATLTGQPLSTTSAMTLEAGITNLGVFVAQLPGPATLNATLRELTGDLSIDATVDAPRGVSARLSGRPLSDTGLLTLEAVLGNLGVFVPQLPGPARVNAVLRDPTGAQMLAATVSATGLDATLDGSPKQLNLGARLDRLSRVAPGLSGGANVTARVQDLQGSPDVDVALRTDTGATARIAGRVGLPNGGADLDISGQLPLGLAAAFIGDRAVSGTTAFDMRLSGPLQLSSLVGQVQVSGARLFDPGIGLTVSDLNATARIANARANVTASALANEGRMSVTGGVGLTAPFQSDIDIGVDSLIYTIESFVRTRVNAALSLRGPAMQRLAVSGDIGLFDTEIRVPDTGLGGAEAIPDISHVGASQSVIRTQRRAGVGPQDGSATTAGGPGPVIPLDIRIAAGDPIFVRGRGLDAAFGGALQLGGTAASPEPVGQFTLQRGRLDFLGRRLDLTEGRVVLSGTQVPRIRVVAESVLETITAQVVVDGPADAPDITITSTPSLPQDEVLALLLFGRSFDTLSPFQVARLIASIRTLAGKGNGILDGTRRVFGLDDLDVRTDETTGETELSFGRRISEDVYSEVEVGSQGEVQLNLNLDLGRNTRLRGSASNTGDTGVGIFWERDY